MRHAFLRIAWATQIVLFATPALAGQWQAVEAVPGRVPITVTVKRKSRVYFRIEAGVPLALTVEGPARLRVVSRAELQQGANRAISYRVQVLEDGSLLKEQSTESSVAHEVAIPGAHVALSKSRSIMVDVPAGGRHMTVAVSGVPSLLVRLLISSPARGEGKMVSITPLAAPRSVILSEGEKLIPYYTAFPGRPVKFRLVGPTSLELSTRLDFDATMRGTQAYRVLISEDGKRIRETEFKTTKATGAWYTDLKDRSASKLDQTVIPVDAGTHEVVVEVLEPKNGSVEVHARIPQPSVGSAE